MRWAPLTLLCLFALGLPPSAGASRYVLGGGAPVRDALGVRWSPLAAGAEGGRAFRAARGAIARTASTRLYRSCRAGTQSVRVPVAEGPGTYGVVLRFLGRSARPQPFDVVAEDAVVAPGVTVAGRRVGSPLAVSVVVSDGELTLGFTGAGAGAATLCALEVRRVGAATTPPAMTWGDDFLGAAGLAPTDSRWTFYRGVGDPPGRGAKEIETYTSRPSNVALDGNGALRIVARRERHADPSDGVMRHYSSGRVGTDGHFAFTYGLLSARLKLPAGKGIWPAFWLLGDDVDHVGWPRAGEIDVAELMGSKPTRLYGSLHGPRRAVPTKPYALNRTTTVATSLAGDFHTYAVLRLPGAIQLLLDGRPFQAYTPADLGPGRPWVYDKPFRILLNLAVGGVWDGAPNASTPFPATLIADWVKLEQWR